MLKPNAYLNFGKMIAATEKEFTISNLKMFQFSEDSAGVFYGEHKGKSFYPTLMGFMTSDYSVGMELIAPNAITKWRKFIGPTNSNKAREEAPTSLRALYGEDGTKNACHGSDAPTSADRELGIVFSSEALVRVLFLSFRPGPTIKTARSASSSPTSSRAKESDWSSMPS